MTYANTASKNSGPIGGSLAANFGAQDIETSGTGNFGAVKIAGTTVGVALAAAAAPMDLGLNDFRVIAAWKDPIADSPGSSLLGLTDTEGAPLLGNAASGNVKTDKGLVTFSLPAWYVSASPITVRLRAKIATTLSTVSSKVDVDSFKILADATLGSDLCTTAAQQVTTSYADYDFVCTPTSRVAGERVHLVVATIADDTGGTINTAMSISKVTILLG